MNQKELFFLCSTFLFSGISEKDVPHFPSAIDPEIVSFDKGQLLELSFSKDAKLGFVVSGECEVIRNKIVLNTLKTGDSFGILSLFSAEPFPTHVLAKKRSSIMFLSKETILSLIEYSPQISMNVMRFLAGRVAFLNQKVATLGGGSVEEKCISYLKNQYRSHGASFAISISAVARKIGAGRASLYRALDSLESREILRREDTNIHILRPELL